MIDPQSGENPRSHQKDKMINRNNAEAWFLDYYEGRLSKEGVEELFAFLVLNPDLREVFDSYDEVAFSPDKKVTFDLKDVLKKQPPVAQGITDSNYEEFLVGAVEGTLSAGEQEQLDAFLAQHPDKRAELELLRKAILEPEEQIVFEGKDALKKSVLVTEENFEEYAVAAIEGELQGEVLIQFNAFLAAHPELEKEFALFAQTKLRPETDVVFVAKDALKKTPLVVTEENFEETAIASVEGLLNAEEEKSLAAFVAAHPAQQKTYALFAQTKVEADATIVFDDKESLKRKEPATADRRGAFWWLVDIRFSAAAAIALLIGIYWFSANDTVVDTNGGGTIAGVDTAKTKNNDNNTLAPVAPVAPGNQLANVDDNAAKENASSVNPAKKENGTIDPPPVKEAREPFTAIAANTDLPALATDYMQPVAFSDAYAPVATNNVTGRQTASLTPGQYAMRWAKKQLDRRPGEDENYAAAQDVLAQQQNENRDVTAFDLTSSAVNRVGHATGANLHLGKETEGTVLTVGKYRVFLSRNR
jgi:anti-sigma factor RsiW